MASVNRVCSQDAVGGGVIAGSIHSIRASLIERCLAALFQEASRSPGVEGLTGNLTSFEVKPVMVTISRSFARKTEIVRPPSTSKQDKHWNLCVSHYGSCPEANT